MNRVARLARPAAPLLLACLAAAQSGPGLSKLTYQPDQVFRSIATIGPGNHGKPMMHDGYLVVVESDPQRGVRFYDVSNPFAPALVRALSGAGLDVPETHTWAQAKAWGGQHAIFGRGFDASAAGGGTGIAIWDWTDIANARLRSSFDLPGVPGGYVTGLFWIAVQAPYVYCPAGSLGLFIVDARDPARPVVVNHVPKSRLGGFNTMLAFAIGNMLIVTSNDAGTGFGSGFARVDISDPIHPQLLYSTTDGPSLYGAQVNGGRLIVPGVRGLFTMHDVYVPTFPTVGSYFVPGTRGASADVQDGVVHAGASSAYFKVDVRDPSTPQVLGGFSTLNPIRDEDWVTPLGNLVAVADDAGNGTHLVPHQAQPDNVGPSVSMVVPENGAANQKVTSRVGITMTDMVELASIDATTFAVRPIGEAPLRGSYTHQFGIVNFVPDEPLQPNTTYEVEVRAGGMRDWAGNRVPRTFLSRFSTGEVQQLVVAAQPSAPAQVGHGTTFDIAAVSGSGSYRFSWDFGDGTPPTPYSRTSRATHIYKTAGHYSVLVSVTDGTNRASDSFVHTVHHALTAARPTRSTTLALDEPRNAVWCVNTDNDSIAAIDRRTLARIGEVNVGSRPRTLAIAPDGSVWVACEGDATVWVLDPISGARVIALPYASAPYGIAVRPDGAAAYVTLRATGTVAWLDVASRRLVATVAVGPEPRGIAIAGDSERIFVTRFRSGAPPTSSTPAGADAPDNRAPTAQVYELSAARFAPVETIALALDPGRDTEASGRGLPNYLSSPAISPDGRRLWVPSKKDNIGRGLLRSGEPLTFQNTVRTIVSQIDLASGQENLAARIDFNDRDMACAVELSAIGDYAFHAFQGSNAVAVTDAYNGQLVTSIEGTGFAPQGLAVTADGAALFVHNYLSRTIAAYDVSSVTGSTSYAVRPLGTAATVAVERLAPQVLRGKQIFHNAAEPRMNEHGYISCATCHLDGDQDGQVWDFTDRGEGLRNTISLLGRAGTAHGRVHWTANFDELQDFEHAMRDGFGGDGFLTAAQWNSGTVSHPLGTPKTGLSAELDALAAYVGTLHEFGRSPHRNPDGTLTAEGVAGKAIFARLGCAQCHSGPQFTDSPAGLLHDVGTLSSRSGRASGSRLRGLDTPTLKGLWSSAPYLHDGSATTLMDVLTTRNLSGLHGNTFALTPQERSALVAYLLQIDDLE
jgi:YVTN family beta-propeller protein